MNYRYLTDTDQDMIRAQKMRAIEADHARLALDLDLAAAAGITEGDQIEAVKADLAVIEAQHAALVERMTPVEDVETGGNGRGPVPSQSAARLG